MNEAVDMSQFVEAKSDQLNSDDLLGAPRTITVTRVTGSEGDQPISIFYQGDNGKPFKPCKTIRRVLIGVWGRYAQDYVGRSMTLYRDDSVTFGGLAVGGIRISHMSHLDKETVVVVMKSKGKKAGIEILPLKDAPQQKASPPASADPAEKWANGYVTAVNSYSTPEQLNKFANDKAGKLAELESKRPELHKACIEALDAKRASFAPATEWDEDFNDGTLAPDNPPATEGTDDSQRGEAHTGDEPPYLAAVRKLRADLAAAPDLPALGKIDAEWCASLRNVVEDADPVLMQSVERDIANRRRELKASHAGSAGG